MPGGSWGRFGFGRVFCTKLGLPNGQGLWKNRARRRVSIGAAGQVEASRRKIRGYWSMPDPEKVPYRASYDLKFPPIGAKNLGLPTGSEGAAL